MNLRSFFHKIIYLGRYTLPRYDLDKCCRFNEYNEAFRFGNRYIEIEGIKGQHSKLIKAGEKYKKEIASIVEPEREVEEKKYKIWEMWYKIKNICMWISIGLPLLALITFVLRGITNMPERLYTVLLFLSSFVIIAFPAFLVTKTGEVICRVVYNRYVEKIQAKVSSSDSAFSAEVRSIYGMMDTLYLRSLDPTHREMVLMHREQAEHNKQIMRMERERQMRENERLQEERRTRRAQERLLEIAEERERERKGYRR